MEECIITQNALIDLSLEQNNMKQNDKMKTPKKWPIRQKSTAVFTKFLFLSF